MSYLDLLRDPRWQRKRLEVMEREDFACQECGDTTTTLNVHHTYYAKGRKPWEYEPESLRCLCQPCHESLSLKLAEVARLVGAQSSAVLDEILGYLRGQAVIHSTEHNPNALLRVENQEQVIGAMAAFEIHGSRRINKLIDVAHHNRGWLGVDWLFDVRVAQDCGDPEPFAETPEA